MKKHQNWYEDKNLWKNLETTLFNPRRIAAAKDEMKQVIKLSRMRKGARVLDLCCGVGRHSLELSRRGFKVVGVDLTEQYVNTAHKAARAEGLNVQFIRDDMRRFCQLDYFDAVINMYTAFGYFESPADDRRVISNIYYSLRKGGTLIMETMSKEILARIYQPRLWSEENGVICLQEHKVSQNWSWVENKWLLLKGRKRYEIRFGHRLYSAAELTTLLKDCGFSSVKIFGDWDCNDYDHNAKRLIAVAKK
ncbi:MAG: class I SAM-dependent methyltransferase [Planctomycetaceae bacterium]|nr:class I SAM-dependent methyltransferase [Planctomycetaceae bacterium]